MKGKLLPLLIALILVIGGGVVIFNRQGTKPPLTSNSETGKEMPVIDENKENNNSPEVSVIIKPEAIGATVKATDSGFQPQALTVKAGTEVVWTNNSGKISNVSSAVHPTHLVYPLLNLGDFDSGQSVSLVFDKAGTYRYHNHLNPSQFGSITVEE